MGLLREITYHGSEHLRWIVRVTNLGWLRPGKAFDLLWPNENTEQQFSFLRIDLIFFYLQDVTFSKASAASRMAPKERLETVTDNNFNDASSAVLLAGKSSLPRWSMQQ